MSAARPFFWITLPRSGAVPAVPNLAYSEGHFAIAHLVGAEARDVSDRADVIDRDGTEPRVLALLVAVVDLLSLGEDKPHRSWGLQGLVDGHVLQDRPKHRRGIFPPIALVFEAIALIILLLSFDLRLTRFLPQFFGTLFLHPAPRIGVELTSLLSNRSVSHRAGVHWALRLRVNPVTHCARLFGQGNSAVMLCGSVNGDSVAPY